MDPKNVVMRTVSALALSLALVGCGGAEPVAVEPPAAPAPVEAAPAEAAPAEVAPVAAPDDTAAAPTNGWVENDVPAVEVAGFARDYLVRAGRVEATVVGVTIEGDVARAGVTFNEAGQRFMQGLRLVKVEGSWSVAAEGPRHELAPGDGG